MPVLSLLLLALAQSLQPPEIRSTAADRITQGITIYHGGYAMVRERRRVVLPEGPTRLALEDVAASIEPKTVHFRILGGPAATVLERNFEFDLLSPENLVKHSLGAKVWIPAFDRVGPSIVGTLSSLPGFALRKATTAEPSSATSPWVKILARQKGFVIPVDHAAIWNPDVIVSTTDGFTTASFAVLALEKRPEGLRSIPTLLLDLYSPKAVQRDVELAYLTREISWNATYVGTLNAAGTRLDLNSFITLTNRMATSFPSVIVQFMAGDPNRIWDPDWNPPGLSADVSNATVEVVASSVRQEQLGDHHLYTLSRPTSIATQQTKQLSFFKAQSVPIVPRVVVAIDLETGLPRSDSTNSSPTYHELQPTWREVTDQSLAFELINSKKHKLGQPLPEGLILVNVLDPSGQVLPMSDGHFEATPVGEKGKFSVPGRPSGFTVDWLPLPVVRRESEDSTCSEFRAQIRFKNLRRDPIQAEIKALIGTDWKLLQAPHPGRLDESGLLTFNLLVPTGETRMELTFQVPKQNH